MSKLLNILLAEDDQLLRTVLNELLTQYGNVKKTPDGETAWDALCASMTNAKGYDLVVLDYGLPLLSGCEVLKRLRAQDMRQGTHTPVLMFTGHGQTVREQCESLGCDGYVTKPAHVEELRKAIEGVLLPTGL